MPQQPDIRLRFVQVLCHYSPLHSELPLWGSNHQKVLSKSHTHSQWLSSLSALSLWNVPLCTWAAVIISLLLVCGSNEINGSLGKESDPALLFCCLCQNVGGGRDGPDVNQKIFSSPGGGRGSDTISPGHKWPSIPEQWVIMELWEALIDWLIDEQRRWAFFSKKAEKSNITL